MGHSLANGQHYTGTKPLAPPFTILDFGKFNAIAQRYFFSYTVAGSLADRYTLGTDTTGATTKASMLSNAASVGNQALSKNILPNDGAWRGLLGYVGGPALRGVGFDAASDNSSPTGNFTAAASTQTLVSGRPGDFISGVGNSQGMIAVWSRVLSALEWNFVRAGNNPRSLPTGLARYWKFLSTDLTTIPDVIGVESLTASVAATASADDAAYGSFAIATQPNLILGVGSNPPVNLGALFDNVSSPFTCSIVQLGVSTQIGTPTTTQATASQIAPLTGLGALANGDYIQFGVNGAPTRVYATDIGTASALFALAQIWTNTTPVFRAPANPFSPSGFAISGNILTPSPVVSGTYPQCIIRATCNANAALFADSAPFTITVSNLAPGSFLRPRARKRRRTVSIFIRR